jgi:hypothetical protein
VFVGRETWLEDGGKRVGGTDTGDVAATLADIDDDLVAQLNASFAYLGLSVARKADASRPSSAEADRTAEDRF